MNALQQHITLEEKPSGSLCTSQPKPSRSAAEPANHYEDMRVVVEVALREDEFNVR